MNLTALASTAMVTSTKLFLEPAILNIKENERHVEGVNYRKDVK